MTDPTAQSEILVVDADVTRHVAYRKLFDGLTSAVVTVTPDHEVCRGSDGLGFAAVLIHLDSLQRTDKKYDVGALVRAFSGAPLILIAADMANALALGEDVRGPLDYMPSPVVPGLLRSKVGVLVDLANTRGDLALAVKTSGDLSRQLEELTAAFVEERRTSEAFKQVVGEQIHRSKNLLAIVQSIALRTLSDGRDMADARNALAGRLRAMARAYQFLTAANGKGTEISDIVEAGLGDVVHRATATGPSARLAGSVVQTFALAIHELASNATKHGALGAPGGSVAVGWTFFENGPERYLEVAWTERGGPPVHAPRQYGFGLTLVSSLARSSSPMPNFTFDPEGFACRMRLSQDMILADEFTA